VGANLFIGNLDENVDERLLYDTFSAFGVMATTAKVRLPFILQVAWINVAFARSLEKRVPECQRATASYHIRISNLPTLRWNL
jgi:RNA recognition motif-containing protein